MDLAFTGKNDMPKARMIILDEVLFEILLIHFTDSWEKIIYKGWESVEKTDIQERTFHEPKERN